MAIEINWLAVLVGAIGYQVLGAIWYGPLFGARWMDAIGFEGHMEDENPRIGYLVTAVGALIATASLAFLVDWTGATTWEAGLGLGVIAGAGSWRRPISRRSPSRTGPRPSMR